ncbi:MAG: transposase [Candidatus Aminicenantes bacterium]|nr:transposase [Candidatus Aminicenantes bacterium]
MVTIGRSEMHLHRASHLSRQWGPSQFGGKSVDKLEYLNKKVFSPLKAELLPTPRGKKEYQAFVERSPQTDDNEFYIPQIERFEDLEEFYYRALRWQFVYNTKRHHSTLSMTPFQKLSLERKLQNLVAIFPVAQLEKLTDLYPKLFSLPGYHASTNDAFSFRLTDSILAKQFLVNLA